MAEDVSIQSAGRGFEWRGEWSGGDAWVWRKATGSESGGRGRCMKELGDGMGEKCRENSKCMVGIKAIGIITFIIIMPLIRYILLYKQ